MASAMLPHAFTDTWRPPTEPQTSASASIGCGSADSAKVTTHSPKDPTTRNAHTTGIVPPGIPQIR